MPQSYTCLTTHIIFSTKTRQPLIETSFADRLYGYIGGIVRDSNSTLLAAGGMPDHVHLLVRCHPSVAMADLLRLIKSNSSKWMHDTISRDFGWQAGYAAFSVSRSNINPVAAYIARQLEHHQTQTFQEELIGFLERHGVEYDERYIWK